MNATITKQVRQKGREELEPSTSQPLGEPLPKDEHACSVSLPTWASVVGYEEGDERITSAMRCGYPRFMYHPLILQLMSVILLEHSEVSKEDCLLLPGYAAAVRCRAFLLQALEGPGSIPPESDNALLCVDSDYEKHMNTGTGTSPTDEKKDDFISNNKFRIRIVNVSAANVYAVLFPAQTLAGMEAKAYWQHTGEIVSSRRAEEALKALGLCVRERRFTCNPAGEPYIHHPSSVCDGTVSSEESSNISNDESEPNDTFSRLRQRIAKWARVPSEDSVFLTPSGMASIYTALRSARRYQLLSTSEQQQSSSSNLGGRSIVYGFPYLDTLKLCSRREFCPGGVDFFGLGNEHDLKFLEQLLQQQSSRNKVCALFTEVPSNPLLQCPDLYALRSLADKYDFALIVDDTIGNFLNIDMIQRGIADAVCTSLTKIVSGRGDAMAGSIVANPNTEKGRWMQQDLQKCFYGSSHTNNDTASGLFEADAKAILGNSRDFEERNQKINETSEILADWLKQHTDVNTVYYPKYAPLYPSFLSSTGSTGYGGLMSILLESHMCQRHFYDSLNTAKGPSLGTNFTLVCPYTLLAHYHELDFAMSYNVPPNLLRISVGLEDANVLKAKFQEAFDRSRLYPKLRHSLSDVSARSAAQTRSFSTWAVSSSSSPSAPRCGHATTSSKNPGARLLLCKQRPQPIQTTGILSKHTTMATLRNFVKRLPH